MEHAMQRPTKITVQLVKADAEPVYALRLEEYKNSAVFTLRDPDALRWDEEDDSGLVLGIRDADGTLLSTMRAIIVNGRQKLESFLRGELPDNCPIRLSTRCMLLERAATRRTCRNLGLNSLMRMHFLDVALRCRVGYLVGVLDRGASRISVMLTMGYQFSDLRLRELYVFPSKTETLFALLDLGERAEQALGYLRNACSALVEDYPLISDLTPFIRRWATDGPVKY